MNLLSVQSCKRLDIYFKFIGQFGNYKQLSYLSFFLNESGNQLKYDPLLNFNNSYLINSNNNKNSQESYHQNNKYSLQQYMQTINQSYLYSNSLLTGMFNNHIMSYQQSQIMLRSCVNLNLLKKNDIVNYMFGNKISFDIKQWLQYYKLYGDPIINDSQINKQIDKNKNKMDHTQLQSFRQQYKFVNKMRFTSTQGNFKNNIKGKLRQELRKNYFIVIDKEIRQFSEFQRQVSINNYRQILIDNQFLNIPNINKILCVNMSRIQDINRFNNDLMKNQQYFRQNNIKIKKLQSNQYIDQNGKNKGDNNRYDKQSTNKQKNNKQKDIKQKNKIKQYKSINLGYRIHKLLQYIHKNIKGNTLIHQLPEYYKFYNRAYMRQVQQKQGDTNKESKRQDNSMNKMNNLHMIQPKETFIFTQRVNNLSQVNSFKYHNNFEYHNQNTSQYSNNSPYQLPKQQFSFQQFTISFRKRFNKDPYINQLSKGLLISRYLSQYNKLKYHKLIQMEEKGKFNIALPQ